MADPVVLKTPKNVIKSVIFNNIECNINSVMAENTYDRQQILIPSNFIIKKIYVKLLRKTIIGENRRTYWVTGI